VGKRNNCYLARVNASITRVITCDIIITFLRRIRSAFEPSHAEGNLAVGVLSAAAHLSNLLRER